jgi:hypothetical protein
MAALLAGMTPDCFNDVAGIPKLFVGPDQSAEFTFEQMMASPPPSAARIG